MRCPLGIDDEAVGPSDDSKHASDDKSDRVSGYERSFIDDESVEQIYPMLGPGPSVSCGRRQRAASQSGGQRKRRQFVSGEERAAAKRERAILYNARRRAQTKEKAAQKKSQALAKEKGKDTGGKDPSKMILTISLFPCF
eukprot:gene7644-800_t